MPEFAWQFVVSWAWVFVVFGDRLAGGDGELTSEAVSHF